jgi:biopolymer transport protein TolR
MVATVTRGGSGRGRRTINEINMVPFIDVMLVLLIIFMVTAPLISPSVIDLPSMGKANKAPDQVIKINIDKSGSLTLETAKDAAKSASIAASKVADAVKKIQGNKTDTPVVISADKAVKYEAVVEVMDTLQRAGIQRVGLSVQLAK